MFELPSDLAREVEMYDGADSPRRAWMVALPEIVAELSRRWLLEVGRPYQPGGCASWVAPALDCAGDWVVLKVGWRHDEAEHEADGLRAWRREGTVRLVDALTFEDTSALLLERCEPGTALADVLAPDEQDAVVAGLLRRLWSEPRPGHPFRALSSMCDRWAEEFERKYAATDTGTRLDPGLARAGIELFRALPRTADRTVLLYTDLNPENILAARREPGWRSIPSRTWGTRPRTRSSTCSTTPTGWPQTPADSSRGWPGWSTSTHHAFARSCSARCVQESIDAPNLREVAIALRL